MITLCFNGKQTQIDNEELFLCSEIRNDEEVRVFQDDDESLWLTYYRFGVFNRTVHPINIRYISGEDLDNKIDKYFKFAIIYLA